MPPLWLKLFCTDFTVEPLELEFRHTLRQVEERSARLPNARPKFATCTVSGPSLVV